MMMASSERMTFPASGCVEPTMVERDVDARRPDWVGVMLKVARDYDVPVLRPERTVLELTEVLASYRIDQDETERTVAKSGSVLTDAATRQMPREAADGCEGRDRRVPR